MAEIDEARIIAWIDGELSESESAEVDAAIAHDPELAALAEKHRAMKIRFAAAFGPIAAAPVEAVRPAAQVISLAAVRAEREALKKTPPPKRSWAIPGAIAASLLMGMLVGHQIQSPTLIGDRQGALALGGPIAAALDHKLSGEAGPVQVALSFKDRGGALCRSFTATNLSGVACRADGGWQLRYGSGGEAAHGDYRMAGGNAEVMSAVEAMIAGDPLDRDAERKARDGGWK